MKIEYSIYDYSDERYKKRLHSAIILISSILLAGVLCLVSGCFQPAPAAEIDLSIIATIESSNNPLAYNEDSGARGLYQITEICLKDYNQYAKRPANAPILRLEALFSPEINKKVAQWYLNKRIPQLLSFYHIEDTIDTRLFAYNAGIGRVIKGIMPRETRNYILKYQRLAKNQ